MRGVHATYVARLAGGQRTLLWMDPAVLSFRYVPGTQVPERGPIRPIDRRPSTWVPTMAAAFNGGFWLRNIKPGGYYYDGTLAKPLAYGQAAMVVTKSGRLSVGMWGRDQRPGADVLAVRENLPLVIDGYRDRVASVGGPRAWGHAINGLPTANRSALGELADGSLVYEYGSWVTPEQIARGLLAVHARTGMMLDMNGIWPAAFVYRHSHGRVIGQRVDSSTFHGPALYYQQYIKDFVVAGIR